jgi:hypothetical protein
VETIEQYFKRPDTPATQSPTAIAMRELLKLRPELSFEDARATVNRIGPSIYGPTECAKLASRAISKAA